LRFLEKNLLSWQPGFPTQSADLLRNLQQYGIQHASEEWKSADFPRNLQQFGIQNVSEEWKSADFLRNLQQFGTKNPRNGNNSFAGNVNFLNN
jgi:phosphohistidine phosphatase SixA